MLRRLYFASEHLYHQLHAVADAQYGDASCSHVIKESSWKLRCTLHMDRVGAPRKDDDLCVSFLDLILCGNSE